MGLARATWHCGSVIISGFSGSRTRTTEKSAQLTTKLFSGDEVDVEVVGVDKVMRLPENHEDLPRDALSAAGLVRDVEIPQVDVVDESRAAQQDIDERSGDEHGGGHGRVGGRGRLLMLLKSEVDGGVLGRSTYLSQHDGVDDEDSHRQDGVEQRSVDDAEREIDVFLCVAV